MEENLGIIDGNNIGEERNYTVYMHTSPSGKRYIGITCQNPPKNRWGNNGCGYKTQKYFYRAIEKYGWNNFKHEILFTKLTKSEAEQKEIEMIKKYCSDNKDCGYNIEHGGNSSGKLSEETRLKLSASKKGMSISDETKEKISQAMIGEKNHFYGKHHTEETKQKLSESHKGKESKLKGVPKKEETKQKLSESAKIRYIDITNHPMYRVNHTEESRKKMSESHKGLKQSEEHRKHNSESHKKPIIQYSKGFEFIKRWDSATDAANVMKVHSTNIAACCKGVHEAAYGYIWRYANEC